MSHQIGVCTIVRMCDNECTTDYQLTYASLSHLKSKEKAQSIYITGSG